MKHTRKKAQKLGDLVREYRRIYRLSNFDGTHDAVHAMTGLGIGAADELRVAVIEVSLLSPTGVASLQKAIEDEKGLHEELKNALTREWDFVGVTENKLERRIFRENEAKTHHLSRREIKALHQLGIRMSFAIQNLRLDGILYRELSYRQVSRIDFSKVDFVKDVHEIKRKYEKTANKKIAQKTARAFYEAAKRQRRARDIPKAGAPWHGPLKKIHGAGK